MLWPPLKGSLYIFTGCRYVSELLPSAWGKAKITMATKRNKNLPKSPKEGWTPNNIDLIAWAPVIVPDREVWDRLWHLRVQVNFSDSECIMGWCLFGVIYSSSRRQTYRFKSLGFGSEPLPRAIDPDVERLHPEQSNNNEKKSLICRIRKSKRQSHLWFYLVPWSRARYLFKTALLVAAWWWDWSIVDWDVLKKLGLANQN